MTDGYTAATMPLPDVITSKADAMDFLPDGRLAVGFHEAGQVYIYDDDEWRLFAEGLHEPFGLHAAANDELVVAQRPELTRLRDANGDGIAEEYETISQEFGMAGNYDEFASGPAVDSAGNYYIALATANGDGMEEKRGEVREAGKGFGTLGGDGRDAHVPYRGWVLKITPDGETIPWGHGFRVGDGITVDSEDRVFVTDQQGGWVGMNKLFHVRQGDFCGFPASIVWDDTIDQDPGELPPEQLNLLRTPAAVKIPYPEMGNSTVEVVQDTTGGGFGPFEGQLFVGEWVQPMLIRVMLDEVAGRVQGACTPFLEGDSIGPGTHRLAFGPEDRLWVGKTIREGWGGSQDVDGLKVIKWDGTTPFEVLDMSLTTEGFELEFTKEVDSSTALQTDAYSFTRYYHAYTGDYGSAKHDETAVQVSDIEASDDGLTVSIALSELRPGYVYALEMDGVESAEGETLQHPVVHYTLNRLQDGTTGDPQFD